MTIGTAIRLLRAARGLTLKAVAMRGGGSLTLMHKIEQDERDPNENHIGQLAKGLGVSANLLSSIQYRRIPNAPKDRILLLSLKTTSQAAEQLADILGELTR